MVNLRNHGFRRHACVQFGIYEVDLDEGELRKAGIRIKLCSSNRSRFCGLYSSIQPTRHPGNNCTTEFGLAQVLGISIRR